MFSFWPCIVVLAFGPVLFFRLSPGVTRIMFSAALYFFHTLRQRPLGLEVCQSERAMASCHALLHDIAVILAP